MNIYDFKAEKNDGEIFNLGSLRGKVLLIVNTATGCGFTPQYEALERLYRQYKSSGFEILDFPCDQFGHQAPGDDSEIHEFCTAKYKTSFLRFKKTEVNEKNASPIWKSLKENSPEEYIKGAAKRKGSKFPPNPINIYCSSFTLDISHAMFGKGNRLNSVTLPLKRSIKRLCPVSCKNGYKNIAVNNPSIIISIDFIAFFKPSPQNNNAQFTEFNTYYNYNNTTAV